MKRIVLVVAPMVAILAVVGLGLGFLVIRRGPVGPGPRRWFDRRPIKAAVESAAEVLPQRPEPER